MAPRPAKRQRRATIVLSEDSDPDFEQPSSKASKRSLQREITLDGRTSTTVSPAKSRKTSVSKKSTADSSPKSSPDKARKNSKAKSEPEKSRSIHNFFGKATEEQRWRKKAETPDIDLENGELGDAIEDDDLSDETLHELGLKPESTKGALDRRKPVVPAIGNIKRTGIEGGHPSSQRFITNPAANRGTPGGEEADHATGDGHLPWADRFGPSNLDELVVHKKKVADVQHWLQGKLDGRNHERLLVLKGPAGSGKTTTLSLIAKALGLHLVCWHNPTVSEVGANNTTAQQFDEFLNRGGRFGSLAFDQGASNQDDSKVDPSHRVLVIEEFPATTTRFSTILQSFRSVILQYLSRSKTASLQHSRDNSPPVVIIISETLLSSSTAFSDSFTAHRILGPEILNHPMVTTMDFNPVASTFVAKALDMVVKKEARESGRRRMPGPAVMQRLAEMGDVRSAVNSLEFLCLRGGDGPEWSGTVAAKARRVSKDKDNLPLTETEKNSLHLVSQRETTLDMFHATGKVVYNKREDPRVLDTRAEPPPKPPDHLMHLYTPKASQVDIEALLNETGTDIQTFISTLHENYVLSCNGDTFEESFDGCADILSVSDILNPENRPSRRARSNPNAGLVQANLQAGSSDTLRQDEISFQVATRGLLFCLPYPVSRASPPGGKKSDTFKMFYPASLRLWKPTEEMESLLDMFVFGEGAERRASALPSDSGSIIGGVGGVASWGTRPVFTNTGSSAAPKIKSEAGTDTPPIMHEDAQDIAEPLPVRYAKPTLTAEILPYMARIFKARKQDTSVLERVTRFRPFGFLSPDSNAEEEPFEDDDHSSTSGIAGTRRALLGRLAGPAAGQSPKTDPVRRLAASQSAASGANANANANGSAGTMGVEKLYISDDDIEDD